MHNPETGVRGDYHPNEVDHMKLHGFRVDVAPVETPGSKVAAPLPPPPAAPAAKPQLGMPKRKD
jgi:hypothetical protein